MRIELFDARDRLANAQGALEYWQKRPCLAILEKNNGSFAVVSLEFQADAQGVLGAWHQTSPEEIEAFIAEFDQNACRAQENIQYSNLSNP